MGADGGTSSGLLPEISLEEYSSFLVYKTSVICYTTGTYHFIKLFSIRPAAGIRTRIMEKYEIDASWPMMMNGCSTDCPPIHVRISKSITSIQNRHWLIGRNIRLRCFAV